MKSKKQFYMIGAVLLVIAFVAGSGFLFACGPHRFSERGFHPGCHGKDFQKHIFAKMDSKIEKLDLTEEQSVQYEEIKEKVKADLVEMRERRKAFMKDMEEEISREAPDINRVNALLKERLRKMPSVIERHMDRFVEFYNILDDDQKARIMGQFKEKMERFKALRKKELDA